MKPELNRRLIFAMTEQRKYFTPEQANATLPLVRKVVADILESYGEWRDLVQQYELMVGAAPNEPMETEEHERARESVEAVATRINEYIQELVQIGCVLKGFDDGLVDFYSKRNGRDVFLCWKFGEKKVNHWHEMEAGFAGRQPLEPDLVYPNVD